MAHEQYQYISIQILIAEKSEYSLRRVLCGINVLSWVFFNYIAIILDLTQIAPLVLPENQCIVISLSCLSYCHDSCERPQNRRNSKQNSHHHAKGDELWSKLTFHKHMMIYAFLIIYRLQNNCNHGPEKYLLFSFICRIRASELYWTIVHRVLVLSGFILDCCLSAGARAASSLPPYGHSDQPRYHAAADHWS